MLNHNFQVICNGMLVSSPLYRGSVFKVIGHRDAGSGYQSLDIVGIRGSQYGNVFINILDTSVVFKCHSGCYRLFCEIAEINP